jgi:hypothetical protein
MMTLQQLKEDFQTMVYILLVYKFLPKDSFKRMIVRIEYIRYGEVVEYEINNPTEVADRALRWITNSIQSVENEMLKPDGMAFIPKRNEYCHSCFLAEDGKCPLFNKNISGKLEDPFACTVSTIESCQTAWKRIETNKAETTRLTKLCKAFVEQCDKEIKIDKIAVLDFYLTKSRSFDVKKTLEFLLGVKKIDIMTIVKYLNITKTNMDKLIEYEKLELTQEELDSISVMKKESVFDAYTPEEIKGKDIINT